jgi:hypothetical protein
MSYLTRLKELNLCKPNPKPQPTSLACPTSPASSQSPQEAASGRTRQEERQRFFDAYTQANGDAATQIIPDFLYLGGHRSVNKVGEIKLRINSNLVEHANA